MENKPASSLVEQLGKHLAGFPHLRVEEGRQLLQIAVKLFTVIPSHTKTPPKSKCSYFDKLGSRDDSQAVPQHIVIGLDCQPKL